MKLFPGYKKQFSFLLFGFLLLLPVFFVRAQSADDLRSKIEQKDRDIARLEAEIRAYQKELDGIVEEKNSLSNSIKELDLTRKKLNTDIAVTESKIDKTNLTITSLSSSIGTKEEIIGNNIESLKSGIKRIHEFESSSLIETLLSEDDFATVWNDIDNIASVHVKVREDTQKVRKVKGELEDTRAETIKAKNELTQLKARLADQRKIVIQNTNDKNNLLKQTKNSEANYQKLLKERIAERDAFEKELEDYEAQLQYILDPSKLPAGRVLSWPLENILITQFFGKTVDSRRLYASGTHNGVDFRAPMGTPVMAMADGTVLGVGDTDQTCYGASFGKFVFIKYNNGLASTFGHLSLTKVREGQEVRRGQVVAYSGNTGHSTGPHLHVSLYASEAVKMASKESKACGGRSYYMPISPATAYLDVLAYLPPYTSNMVKR